METVQVILPVLAMIIIGFAFKKTGFLSEDNIEGIRKYIINIALPVTIFHAMSVANIDIDTIKIVGIMFAVLSIAMIIGFLTRGITPEPYKNYYPFLITIFEGGMFAYPLYQNLCGEERFANIVIIDIAGCLFGFGLFFGLLALVDQKSKINIKTLGLNALKSPTFVAVILGLIFNLTGIMDRLLGSVVGDTYIAVKEIIVVPLTTMILIYVGYMIKIDKKIFGQCIKAIAVRLITMASLCFITIKMLHNVVVDKYMLYAFLVYFLCPPSFALTSFVKDKKAGEYFAMTTSMYVIITIIGYSVIAMTMATN